MRTGLCEVESELSQLNTDFQTRKSDFEKYVKGYNFQKEELLRQKSLLMSGLDLDRIKNAEATLRIQGLDSGVYNERCVLSAISDIANGTNKMAREYFGVKNYSGWTHQECDCRYNYGPRHGYIVFSVGLKKPNEPLTDDQKEDCLYLLNLLRDREKRAIIVKPKSA